MAFNDQGRGRGSKIRNGLMHQEIGQSIPPEKRVPSSCLWCGFLFISNSTVLDDNVNYKNFSKVEKGFLEFDISFSLNIFHKTKQYMEWLPPTSGYKYPQLPAGLID